MSQPHAPSAIALNESPETLLRNRNPHARLNICDSKLAAVIEQGSYFITSPNADNIISPVSGATRSLHLRQNGLWGDDDPIQWPQIFTSAYCHFSAIPSRPTVQSGPTDDEQLMLWYHPTREEFICPASGQSILRGCGKLPSPVFRKFRGALNHVQLQFNAFKNSYPSGEIPPLLPHLMQTAAHAISRLELLPTGYMELLLTVRALQRSLLEAIAIMDYKQMYQPRIAGLTRRDAAVAAVDPRMGAFTDDLRTVEDHVAAGLKVWFIQPSSAFRFQNILAIAPLIIPENVIEMALLRADASPTFVGNHMGKIDCIHHLTRKIGYTADPFNEPRATLDPSMESAVGPSRNQSHSSAAQTTSSTPYSKEAKALHPNKYINVSGRDKFKPVDSPYMPDYIPAWKKALASVNTHRPIHSRSPEDRKYMFPDIALFCTAASDDRKARYFTMWTYLRDALIYRVFGPTAASHPSAVPLSSQDWRDLLNGGILKLDAEPQAVSKRGKPKVTKNRSKLLSLDRILGPCLDHAGVSLDLSSQPIDMALPTTDHARAQLWEISELNFRLEFIALDRRLHITRLNIRESREQLIYSCFPGWSTAGFSLFDCDLVYAKRGMAAPDWKEKLTFLLRLNTVMASWVDYHALHISIPAQHDEVGVLDFEYRLARFYCQSFFEAFGRPPTLPMALI
ncbi:hypothetical protein B0H11DRAFT_2050317 [Mycena galericulata]|nr:hypothetical protein B0H11DRAFT_2050317 [Mycena galericulata]